MKDRIKPRSRSELLRCVRLEISKNATCDLNHIDVSGLEHLDGVFADLPFNGDVSRWDTSKAKTMRGMFRNSRFQGNLSMWNVRNVENFTEMFEYCPFQGDLSLWNANILLKPIAYERMFSQPRAIPPLAWANHDWNDLQKLWSRTSPQWSKMLRRQPLQFWHFVVKANKPKATFKTWTPECEQCIQIALQCTGSPTEAAYAAFNIWSQRQSSTPECTLPKLDELLQP